MGNVNLLGGSSRYQEYPLCPNFLSNLLTCRPMRSMRRTLSLPLKRKPMTSRASRPIATIACLSLEGDYEATPVHHIIWRCDDLLAAGFARAAGGADAEHRGVRRPSVTERPVVLPPVSVLGGAPCHSRTISIRLTRLWENGADKIC